MGYAHSVCSDIYINDGRNVNNQKSNKYQTTCAEFNRKKGYEGALLKIWVHEVPKAMSSKSRETDRLRDVRGIVIRADECTLERHSWGTQYSKPPPESLTQPSMLGFANSSGWFGLQEMEANGNASHTRVVLSQDPEMMCCPSEE